MNRSELIGQIAAEHGLAKAEAEKIVGAILDRIVSAVREGSRVNLSGFGNFELRQRAARTARNPRTGALLQVKAHKALAFRPTKAVRDALNS